MKLAARAILALVLALSLCGCQGRYLLGIIKGCLTEPTVVAAGRRWEGPAPAAGYVSVPARSRMSTQTTLPGPPQQGGDTGAFAVACLGDEIFAAGYFALTYMAAPVACYWTGDARHDLPGGVGPRGARALSIFISGQTILTAGQYFNGTKAVACWWANDVKTDLLGGAGDACANSIVVSGGVVYAAGFWNDGAKDIPCCWRDGTRTNLPAGSGGAAANAVCVSGGSVYAAGFYNNGVRDIACVWKDGVRTDLPDAAGGSCAYSICFAGGSCYIAGYYDAGLETACFWKDGVRTDLPLAFIDARAYSLCVVDGTVYAAGSQLWIDDGRETVDIGGWYGMYAICEGPSSSTNL